MQDSRIEQKIEDIYGFIESCKMQKLSATKVVVPKNDLYDLLDDLRRDVPEEIRRYRKMLNQRDAILEDARKKAAEILADAKEQYSALVEEQSIMQEAYQQAEETVRQANEQAEAIVANARNQAGEIGNGSIYYSADVLQVVEDVIAKAYESTVNNAKALETALSGHLEIVRQNKAELMNSIETPQEPQETAMAQEMPEPAYEEEVDQYEEMQDASLDDTTQEE